MNNLRQYLSHRASDNHDDALGKNQPGAIRTTFGIRGQNYLLELEKVGGTGWQKLQLAPTNLGQANLTNSLALMWWKEFGLDTWRRGGECAGFLAKRMILKVKL